MQYHLQYHNTMQYHCNTRQYHEHCTIQLTIPFAIPCSRSQCSQWVSEVAAARLLLLISGVGTEGNRGWEFWRDIWGGGRPLAKNLEHLHVIHTYMGVCRNAYQSLG